MKVLNFWQDTGRLDVSCLEYLKWSFEPWMINQTSFCAGGAIHCETVWGCSNWVECISMQIKSEANFVLCHSPQAWCSRAITQAWQFPVSNKRTSLVMLHDSSNEIPRLTVLCLQQLLKSALWCLDWQCLDQSPFKPEPLSKLVRWSSELGGVMWIEKST